MATITIPSPSAFLDSPVIQPAPSPRVSVKTSSKKRSSTTKAHRASLKAGPDISKPKQTKSRNGCTNCKEKRLKCDEGKPTCVQCQKKGVECKGYKKVLKWRPQEDTFKHKTGPPKPRRNSTAPKPLRKPSPSPSHSDASPSPTLHALSPSISSHPSFPQPPIPPHPQFTHQSESFDNADFSFEPPQHSDLFDAKPISLRPQNTFPSATPSLINDSHDEDNTPLSAKTVASTLWTENSPQVADLVSPSIDLNAAPCDFMDLQPEQSMALYAPDPTPTLQILRSGLENDVEDIVRGSDPADSWFMPLASPTSSDSSSSSAGSWVDAFAATLWGQPVLHADGEDMLMMRFDKETCGILSIKDGPTENPWRTMLWPLAMEESTLRHAITAMTAFHASKEKPGLKTKGMEHMNQCLQLMSRRMTSMKLTTSLATTLVLAFCESWDMLISTGITHLNMARQLVAQIVMNYSQGTMAPENEPRLGFLCRTWVYMDVIARLTSLQSDDSEDFDIATSPLCQLSTINHDVDPLMGCAKSMFPIIGRVANLVRRVRQRTKLNSLEIISQATDLKSKLEKWRPPLIFEAPEDQTTEIEQALRTAESYRGATLLYLHQAVPEISYESATETIVNLAKSVLTNIANVPPTSGAVIIHIFPLLAAGCEAVDPESRAFVEQRWEAMMRRMNIQNLDKCLIVVREVWNRRASAEHEEKRRKARMAASKIQTGYMPATIMKRKYSTGDEDAADSSKGRKRRPKQSVVNKSPSIGKPELLRKESSVSPSDLDPELTVRGRQHWAGVMKDFRWEVLIG